MLGLISGGDAGNGCWGGMGTISGACGGAISGFGCGCCSMVDLYFSVT
jgi:hypothetical protein